jgi:NAD(P)-dependent dehydrogenase (short-subunit alcohol dehydrogenase family)
MSDLKDKVAFIAGAAHGQGRATALALGKEGVHKNIAEIILRHEILFEP